MTSGLRRSSYVPLLLILLIFTALAVYYSLVLPLGEAPDETVHFDVIEFIANVGHPPTTADERTEAGLRGGFAPLYYTLMALPITIIDTTPPPQLRRLDLKSERHIPDDGLSTQQILHTEDESIPGQGVVLAWRIVRWLSIPLGWLTIVLTYAIAQLVVPRYQAIALGAAIFVAFLPRFVINSSVINEDNLAIPLAATVLWLLIKIIKGDIRTWLFVGLGVALALAALTKYYNLVLLPEVFVFLALSSWHRRWSRKEIIYRWGLMLLAFAVVAGPWFVFILWRFGRIAEQGWLLGVATALGEPQIIGGLQKLQGAATHEVIAPTFGFGEWFFGLLFRSFWVEFGWMTIFAATPLYWLMGGLTACAIIGTLYAFYTNRTALRNMPKLLSWLLLTTHIALFFGVISLRYSLGQTIDTGQGRHLFPALPAIAIFFVVGLAAFIQLVSRKEMDSRKLVWLNVSLGTLLLIIGITFPLISILPVYYPYLPVTTASRLPQSDSDLPLNVTDQFSLIDFVITPRVIPAGSALPVTLTWQVHDEVNQDYLVSLCLQDEKNRSAACWRGHFANGRYPARTWETGDIFADTIHIPIPTCYRLAQQDYTLHLDLWPLKFNSPTPITGEKPLLTHTFDPKITITPTDSLNGTPQTTEVWLDNQRLTGPTTLGLNQGVTYITFTQNSIDSPTFNHVDQEQTWSPLSQFNTELHLPCDDGPSPFSQASHFIVDSTLSSGEYQSVSNSVPPITLNIRNRNLSPLTSTLTFSHTLAPLALQLAGQPFVDLTSQYDKEQPFTLHPSGSIAASSLPVTLNWQSHRWMADPLVISLKLLDKDFNVGGEYVAGLGDRYPNVLWAPTEMVRETYPVQINPDTPPGLYQLEISLIHQNKNLPNGYEYLPVLDNGTDMGTNLYPTTIRLLDPAHGTPPSNTISAQLGDSIHLIGYDLTTPLTFALYWENTNTLPADYTVFTQLIGPDGQVWAQWDNPPLAGRYPTTAWTKNDAVVDRYTLSLREGAPTGEYRLLVGMYAPTTGERLPASIDGQAQPNNAIQLTTLMLP